MAETGKKASENKLPVPTWVILMGCAVLGIASFTGLFGGISLINDPVGTGMDKKTGLQAKLMGCSYDSSPTCHLIKSAGGAVYDIGAARLEPGRRV